MSPSLGALSMAAASLYVADLDAALAWYREKLELEPIFEGKDEHRFATYQVGGFLFVLEPSQALWQGRGLTGSGAATVNLVTDRDPAELLGELRAAGVDCSDIVDSPGFSSFLFADPDGNRFYLTRPVRDA
ncbi:MAG: VOC family protein [Actinobacteria bacterium]|nr:VOC family protein [Actinomycetota bacterium]